MEDDTIIQTVEESPISLSHMHVIRKPAMVMEDP